MDKKQVKEMEVNKQSDKAKETQKKSQAAPHVKKDDTKNKIIKDLTAKAKESEIKIHELQDKYIRLSAEFDNYRKRTLKEKIEFTKAAGEQILLSLLPVIDDFERGMKNIDESKDIEAVKQGMHLIYNKFIDFLNQNGIKEIDALEKEFDIDFHEAITKIQAPKEELKGKVVDVVQKGYLLNDKVIRFSKVVVGE